MPILIRDREEDVPERSGREISPIFLGKIRVSGNGIRERRPLNSTVLNSGEAGNIHKFYFVRVKEQNSLNRSCFFTGMQRLMQLVNEKNSLVRRQMQLNIAEQVCRLFILQSGSQLRTFNIVLRDHYVWSSHIR